MAGDGSDDDEKDDDEPSPKAVADALGSTLGSSSGTRVTRTECESLQHVGKATRLTPSIA
jgi:hypothetical protein